MLAGQNNLLPRHEARQKSLDNQQVILQFLRQEKFSTVNILQQLLGVKTRAAAWKIVSKMQQKTSSNSINIPAF